MFLSAVLLLGACNSGKQTATDADAAVSDSLIIATHPTFSGDSAYRFVSEQVAFGPRIPNTRAHARCADYLYQKLRELCDTALIQQGLDTTYDGTPLVMKNIIGSFNPSAKNRILLCAHWDTRPFADQDPAEPNALFDGANDGGSGVGVLLQLANIIRNKPLEHIGVDIVFFDAEDWGDPTGGVKNSYCLGSQYWAKNPHVSGYKALYGVLLDMVGGKDALFAWEGNSLGRARELVFRIWNMAGKLGYGKHFINLDRGPIVDDHIYVMGLLGIPMVDIIQYDPNTSSRFASYWHTKSDNMASVDPATLKAVGATLSALLYSENQQWKPQ
ncbi:MAG: M28 family peptidase [Bacteroidetes bacterium]|nr:M28 family peptidase [Bacteroidota bacterium]